ncbi:trypco2 family protein [Glycomyces sp. NPDC047010]|uniref:trypco2 family protein n=1 Tax=Glycomyces sp. NPDC047010 TaxID=3155023 RepID=UPI0033DA599B
MESPVTLGQALKSLRQEVAQAVYDSSDSQIRFRAKEIEVELTLQVTASTAAEAGVSIWSVVTGRASGSDSTAQTHKVRLVLEPVGIDDSGRPQELLLSDERRI